MSPPKFETQIGKRCLILCALKPLQPGFAYLCPLGHWAAWNPGRGICGRMEKSSKTGQQKESFMSTFACCLTATPKFDFWNRDWALHYVPTQTWDFPNISLFSKILSPIVRQLVSQVCYTRYHVSFYLWLLESVLKHFEVPKYYDQDCLKIFFLLSALPMTIQISGKNAHLVQKK